MRCVPPARMSDVSLQLSQRVKERDAEVERLMTEVAQLRESNATLKRNNEILCRNISSIFKTAQIELQRKNRMIEELRCACQP